MKNPPSVAERRRVIPPTTTPASTRIVSCSAKVGVTVGNWTVSMTATTAASAPAISTETVLTRFARTPRSRAVWESIAAARMCRPIDVRFSSATRSARHTAAVTIATIVIFRMSTPPTSTGRLSSTSEVAVFPSGPNQSSAIDWSRNATANVAMSITAADCAAERPEDDALHREREREHDREAERDPDADGPVALRCERERERAGHDQLPVGEVHEPHHAEHEPDADGHEREDRAEADGVDLHLQVEGVADEVGGRWQSSSREVGGDHAIGVGCVVGCERQPELAVREHVRPVGERDRALRALLDEQDADARAPRIVSSVENTRSTMVGARPSDGSSRSRIDGLATSAARDRELLLLAARQGARVPVAGTPRTIGNSSQTSASPPRRRSSRTRRRARAGGSPRP